MSELNNKFPQILLAYVNDKECTLSNNDCNELSKFASGIELERDALASENERLNNLVHSMHTQVEIDTLKLQLAAKQDRCADLESRLDLYHGNMYDVVCEENERLREALHHIGYQSASMSSVAFNWKHEWDSLRQEARTALSDKEVK